MSRIVVLVISFLFIINGTRTRINNYKCTNINGQMVKQLDVVRRDC